MEMESKGNHCTCTKSFRELFVCLAEVELPTMLRHLFVSVETRPAPVKYRPTCTVRAYEYFTRVPNTSWLRYFFPDRRVSLMKLDWYNEVNREGERLPEFVHFSINRQMVNVLEVGEIEGLIEEFNPHSDWVHIIQYAH